MNIKTMFPRYEPRRAAVSDGERACVRDHFIEYCRKCGASLDGVESVYEEAGNWLAEVIAFYVPEYFRIRHGTATDASPPGKSLLIYGEVGRGKTFLARKIYDFYRGVRAKYGGRVEAEFVYDTDFTFGASIKGNEYLEEFFFGYQRKILFFDDIGNEEESKRFGNVYGGREILRFRHLCQEKWSVPTVITTNLTRKSLAQVYGIYVESRVSGYYKGIRIQYPRDRRKEQWV